MELILVSSRKQEALRALILLKCVAGIQLKEIDAAERRRLGGDGSPGAMEDVDGRDKPDHDDG